VFLWIFLAAFLPFLLMIFSFQIQKSETINSIMTVILTILWSKANPRSAVVEDPNFLIFRETEAEIYLDEDPELVQLDFEVEPYEMSVF